MNLCFKKAWSGKKAEKKLRCLLFLPEGKLSAIEATKAALKFKRQPSFQMKCRNFEWTEDRKRRQEKRLSQQRERRPFQKLLVRAEGLSLKSALRAVSNSDKKIIKRRRQNLQGRLSVRSLNLSRRLCLFSSLFVTFKSWSGLTFENSCREKSFWEFPGNKLRASKAV